MGVTSRTSLIIINALVTLRGTGTTDQQCLNYTFPLQEAEKTGPTEKHEKYNDNDEEGWIDDGSEDATSKVCSKDAPQSTKVEDGVNGTQVFGHAVHVQTNVDSGVTEPLERSSCFETSDVQKKSTQTPAPKENKNQVYCLFHI